MDLLWNYSCRAWVKESNLVSEHEPSHALELDLMGLLWLSQDLAFGLFS